MASEKKSLHVEMELENAPEERDHTKWLWAGVLVFLVAVGFVLYLKSGGNPQLSVVRISHILIKCDSRDPAERGQALTRIRSIRERLQKGEDFARLARDNSNDPESASKGGDVGYVTKGQLDKAIDQYAWTAPVGQLSDVIQSQFGFHVVVVTDRRYSKADALAEKEHEKPAGGAPAEAPKP